jgi:hypothetical protein
LYGKYRFGVNAFFLLRRRSDPGTLEPSFRKDPGDIMAIALLSLTIIVMGWAIFLLIYAEHEYQVRHRRRMSGLREREGGQQ